MKSGVVRDAHVRLICISLLVIAGAIAATAPLRDCAVFGVVVMFIGTVEFAFCYIKLLVARYDHTRCRKCNHILCGLSEPRGPECGEGI